MSGLFIPVKPEELPNFREAHRGRVSYPIIKAFLESNFPVAKLDRTQIDKGVQHMKQLLGWYIKSHKLPIQLMTRQGELYFCRLDMDENGVKKEWNPDTLEEAPPENGDGDGGVPSLTADVIAKKG